MTTSIKSRISYFASRSHGQRVVVKEDAGVKGSADRVIGSKEVVKSLRNVMKLRKGYFALIAAHAKKRIVDCRGCEGFSFPMKGMARRTLNVHIFKSVNLPSRIKGEACNREL
jgi:hypothetical protein